MLAGKLMKEKEYIRGMCEAVKKIRGARGVESGRAILTF